MLGRPSRGRRKALEAQGRSASAVVLAAGGDWLTISTGNGSSWNNEVAVKTRIRVEPDGEPSFEWEGRLRFWSSQTPSAGDRIWVRFDPDDHGTLMLDVSDRPGSFGGLVSRAGVVASPFPPAASADPLDRLEQLADLRDRGVLTPDEFEAQKRRLLG